MEKLDKRLLEAVERHGQPEKAALEAVEVIITFLRQRELNQAPSVGRLQEHDEKAE